MSDKEKEQEEKKESIINKLYNRYSQFSKFVVAFCTLNLVVVEAYIMILLWKTKDTSQISYLVTSIAATCLGTVIWYMKNSESEKKARIAAEVERMKVSGEISDIPFDIMLNKSVKDNPNMVDGDITEVHTEVKAKG